MNTIDIRFMTIEDAAQKLVDLAPARGDYWGTTMRARFATTRSADVVAQYRRTIKERSWAYWASLPAAQKVRMVCGDCGARGCKMWREYQTFANQMKILCGPCSMKDQGKVGAIDADGKRDDDLARTDQIGWLVPAVPDIDGAGFWGYTSVPAEACEWWRSLPSYPTAMGQE